MFQLENLSFEKNQLFYYTYLFILNNAFLYKNHQLTHIFKPDAIFKINDKVSRTKNPVYMDVLSNGLSISAKKELQSLCCIMGKTMSLRCHILAIMVGD